MSSRPEFLLGFLWFLLRLGMSLKKLVFKSGNLDCAQTPRDTLTGQLAAEHFIHSARCPGLRYVLHPAQDGSSTAPRRSQEGQALAGLCNGEPR